MMRLKRKTPLEGRHRVHQEASQATHIDLDSKRLNGGRWHAIFAEEDVGRTALQVAKHDWMYWKEKVAWEKVDEKMSE
jgi:hypothetical protein